MSFLRAFLSRCSRLCVAAVLTLWFHVSYSQGQMTWMPIANDGFFVVEGDLGKDGTVQICEAGEPDDLGDCWLRGVGTGDKVGSTKRLTLQEFLELTLKGPGGRPVKADVVGVGPASIHIPVDAKVAGRGRFVLYFKSVNQQ